MKIQLKTKVDKISGQMGVQVAGGNRNGTTGRKYTQTQRWSVGRPLYQSTHTGGENPVGLRLWHSLRRGQTGADSEKAEAGFYNLKRTDLTFEALAEVWLRSQRNSIKESTYAHYSYTLHKYLLPVLSKVPVTSLEESFLEQAMQQIIAPIDAAHKPLGNSSARMTSPCCAVSANMPRTCA